MLEPKIIEWFDLIGQAHLDVQSLIANLEFLISLLDWLLVLFLHVLHLVEDRNKFFVFIKQLISDTFEGGGTRRTLGAGQGMGAGVEDSEIQGFGDLPDEQLEGLWFAIFVLLVVDFDWEILEFIELLGFLADELDWSADGIPEFEVEDGLSDGLDVDVAGPFVGDFVNEGEVG